MKKHLLTILCALCALTTLPAAEPTPIKLKLSEVIKLDAALKFLDAGYIEVIETNGKKEKVPQMFKLGELRLPLAQNLMATGAEVETYITAKKAIIKEVWGDNPPPEETATKDPKFPDFAAKTEPLLSITVEPKLVQITRKDLNLAKNEIPAEVLNALAPILDKKG